jgi:outer membrane immunogenic protein
MQKTIFRGAAALAMAIAASAPATAADMYRPPEASYKDAPAYVGVNWSGLYLGVNGGYGWNANHDNNWLDPEGGFGGGQIGFNVQRGNIVLGAEADLQGADISDRAGGQGEWGRAQMDWFGTLRARAGLTFDRALIYATGGLAFGNVTKNLCYPSCESRSETQTGWVAGGGLEYKVARDWSVKGEYQYLDLDASSLNGPGPLAWGGGTRTQVNTARLGLNYFVGGGYEPLK